LFFSNLSIKKRLPLLIGALLLGIIATSIWAAYRGVKESGLEVGRERLLSLTQQLASQSQQSLPILLGKTSTAANDAAVRAFLQTPSSTMRSRALAVLQQFESEQDPNSLQVELWNSNHTLALALPDGSSPVSADLEPEFAQCAVDPFKAVGLIRAVKDVIAYPAVAAVKGEAATPIGFVVRWRRISPAANVRRQLADLLGSQAALYYGNIEGDVFTDLEKIVPKPPGGLQTTQEVTNYARDGNWVMSTGRPILGTPWFLVVEFPHQALLSEANHFLRRISVIGLVLFAIGLAGAFAVSRGITGPLHSLTQAASAISGGNYSHKVDVRGNNELGRLASAFNAMVVKVRDSKRELERQVSEKTARLDAAPSAMLMVDKQGRITLVNALTEQLFGYTRAELLDQPVEVLVPERYRSGHPGHRTGFFARPSTRAMGAGRDLYGRRKDGTEVPIEIGLNPIHTDEGAFVLASIIDITERKRAEERFRLVVEASPSAIIMVDENGTITLVNTQTEQLFGYKRDELLDQPIEMLVPERYRKGHPGHRKDFFIRPYARAMGAGRDLFGLRKDGTEVPIEIGLNPIQSDEGTFVLASIIDITERKRAQERFGQLIEHAPNGMVMVDQKGKIALVNAQIEKSFGYTREELLGQPIEKLVPERFRENHSGYRDGFAANPSTRAMGAGRDLYGLRKDGTEFPVEIGLNPLETEQGMMVLGTIVDIAERKQAEEKVRRSQEQLAGVIGSAMDAIISVDEEQRIVLFNAAAERMFLFPSEEAIGKPLDRFIPDRFRAGHQKHIQNFGQTHVTRRSMGLLGALFGLRADGEEFPIEASISQIEADGRKLYTVILRDITERKRSEEALKEQARILDLAPVLIRELNGRILFWNTGSEQMYGWTAEEALEKTTESLLKTEYPRAVEEIKARVLAHGHWEGELVHTRKDGERLFIASNWVLHRDEHDKPKAILEVNNDITERKQAEKEIRRLNEELEMRVADRTAQLQAANKELEAFSYSVSHDLRAPLRHINGFSKALLEDYEDKLDQTAKGYLHEVRGASQEMAQLIDDVLQLARVSRSEMQQGFVNLTELARGVVAELQSRDAGRSVTVDIADGLCARCDKRLLRIVLTNLLGNAWKFTSKHKHPQIFFSATRDDGETRYLVRDNGAGFDMAYADKLFGAFQRLHTADEFEGTGIGLATVQRIVHRHGGRVWAEGAVNAGAAFYFTLPDFKETGDGQQSDPTS
jgi:PAS domain S-box-containing protein